jgi:hypothetical protein
MTQTPKKASHFHPKQLVLSANQFPKAPMQPMIASLVTLQVKTAHQCSTLA